MNLAAGAPPVPLLVLMTDSRRLPDPEPAAAALPRGAAVVVRHHDRPWRERLALARRLRGVAGCLVVAGDAALAAAAGADGLHLPEGLARRAPVAALRWRGLLTVAAHGRAGLVRAGRLGADAALLSPVFPTASHPGAPALGVVRFARLVRGAPVPVLALGGVTAATVARLRASGAAGIAAVGALTGSRSPFTR